MTGQEPTEQKQTFITPKKLDTSVMDTSREVAGERLRELLDTDFAPYNDDEVFVRRLNAENPAFRKKPELRRRIQNALMDEGRLAETATALGTARQKYAPRNERPIARTFSYLTACREIMDGVGKAGANESMVRNGEGLMQLLANETARSIPDEQLMDTSLSAAYVRERTQDLLEQTGHPNFNSAYQLMIQLGHAIEVRRNAHLYMDALPGVDEEPVSMETAEQDSLRIHELFDGMRASQTYGVKMGYIPDELGGSLVFGPSRNAKELYPKNVAAKVSDAVAGTEAVADVIHSRHENPNAIQPKFREEYGSTGTLGNVRLEVESLDPLGVMYIGKDGELYTDRACKSSYRSIALANRKYGAYRDLQARILAHHYDLTHPLDQVAEVPKSPSKPKLASEPREPMDAIEELLVPRARRHIVGESNEPDESTDVTSRKGVKLHDVTWHRRQLPEGWNPSPAALKLAQELDITLNPGETVVKEHKRGSRLLGEVVGHKLTKRPQQ